MPYLALALGEGSQLGNGRALVAVDDRASDHAYAKLNQTVLVYRHVPAVLFDFIGEGRVAGVNLSPEGQRLVTIDPYVAFESSVLGENELNAPGAQRFIELADERHSEIIDLSQRTAPGDLAEQAALFVVDDTATLETYLAVHDQVLRAWGYRCCLSGAAFAPGARPHPQLRVVAIRPRAVGGQLHVKNYLPMLEVFEAPWRLGQLAIGPDFGMWLDASRLDPETQDLLRPEYRLLQPSDRNDHPDPDLLAWHRDNVFGRG